MRRSLVVFAASLLALGACTQAPTPVKPRGSKAPEVARASASPGQAAPAGLQKPAGEFTTLSGTIAIDASYAAKTAGARLIGDNGGSAIAVGATVLSNNGGNLISDTGGSLVGNNSSSFGLLADAQPSLGQILPAAGMAVRVYSLLDGQALSLGADEAGKPVYEVLSRPDGSYTLYLPAKANLNVRVEARVAQKEEDRLRYGALVRPDVAALAIDEDVNTIMGYVRGIFLGEVEEAYLDPQVQKGSSQRRLLDLGAEVMQHYPPEVRKKVVDGSTRWGLALWTAGWEKLDDEGKRKAARLSTDAIMAHIDFSDITTTPGKDGKSRLALDVLVGDARNTREGVTATMQRLQAEGQDPVAYFAQRDYIRRANDRDGKVYEIRRPSDVPAFLLNAIHTNDKLTLVQRGEELNLIYASGDLGRGDADSDGDVSFKATTAIFNRILSVVYLEGPEAIDDAADAIRPLTGVPKEP